MQAKINMKQEVIRILITAIVSALIAVLQAYLTTLTKAPIPDANAVAAAMFGGVIATTRTISHFV